MDEKNITKSKGDKNKNKNDLGNKGKNEAKLTQTREIQYFKCLGHEHIAREYPNRKTMILKDGDFESESVKESDDETPLLEDYSDVEYAKGDNLVVQRTLNVQNKIEDRGE